MSIRDSEIVRLVPFLLLMQLHAFRKAAPDYEDLTMILIDVCHTDSTDYQLVHDIIDQVNQPSLHTVPKVKITI